VIRVDADRMIVEGAVRLADVPALLSAGTEALRRGAVAVIDLGAAAGIDSSAVALVLEWTREAERLGRPVRLVNVPPAMLNLATLYGIADFLPIER
jgi:phospholipid transport system transporter-binding protein